MTGRDGNEHHNESNDGVDWQLLLQPAPVCASLH